MAHTRRSYERAHDFNGLGGGEAARGSSGRQMTRLRREKEIQKPKNLKFAQKFQRKKKKAERKRIVCQENGKHSMSPQHGSRKLIIGFAIEADRLEAAGEEENSVGRRQKRTP